MVDNKIERIQLDPGEKLDKIEKVFDAISGVKSLLIGGSVSQRITQNLQGGKSRIDAKDVVNVSDLDVAIDLASNVSPTAALEKILPLSSLIFEIEQNMVQYGCLGNPLLHEIAVRQADVVIGSGVYPVFYMTPEFLLLTCVGAGTGKKTSEEKYQKKLSEIPLLPGFSRAKFIALAQGEISAKPDSDEAKKIAEYLRIYAD